MTQSPEIVIKRTQVVVDPPKPAVEPEKVKVPETDAELEERRQNVMASMGWRPNPKKESPPAAAPAATADEPPAAQAEPAAAAPAATTPPAAPLPAPAPVDAQALIAETGKKIGDQVARAIEEAKPAAKVADEPVTPELTPEDARDLEIIAKMEEVNPASKGKAEEFKKVGGRLYVPKS